MRVVYAIFRQSLLFSIRQMVLLTRTMLALKMLDHSTVVARWRYKHSGGDAASFQIVLGSIVF